MALRNLEVVITLKDNASKGLDQVGKKVRETGKSANQANIDFTKFTKTLFTAGAFIGIFAKSIGKLKSSIEEGADIQRLENQYERVLGPKGALFDNIDKLTTTGIDKFEAMRSGISLANLGIVKSTDQLANIMAEAGTAAKLAGKDSTEGIKDITEFMKSGEVSQLQFLDLIAKTNPALQAQMAVLHKAGGVMGTVISTQARLALGQNLLRAATKGHLKDEGDLLDLLKNQTFAFRELRSSIGELLGVALGPLIRQISEFASHIAKTLENMRKTDKNFIFLVKSVIIATGAVFGLVGALNTLRLSSIALTSIGIGLPSMLALVVTLGTLFLGVTSKAEKFTDKLKILAAFARGIWQLVTSFNKVTGESQISKSITDLLGEDLTNFAVQIARVVIAVKEAVTWFYHLFKDLAKRLDNLFKSISQTIIKYLGGPDLKNKTKDQIQDLLPDLDTWANTAKIALTALAVWWAKKKFFSSKSILEGTDSLLSKMPVIGKFFGTKADGSSEKPFYVIVKGSSLFGGGGDLASSTAKTIGTVGFFRTIIPTIRLAWQSLMLGGVKGLVKDIPTIFKLAFQQSFPRIFNILSKGFSFVVNILKFSGSLLLRLMTGIIIPAVEVVVGAFVAVFGGPIAAIVGGFLLLVAALGTTQKGLEILNGILYKISFGKLGYKPFEVKNKEEELKAQFDNAKKMGWSHTGSFEEYKKFREEKNAAMQNKFASSSQEAAFTPKESGEKSLTSVPRLTEDPELMLNRLGEETRAITDKKQRAQAEVIAESTMDALAAKGQSLTSEDIATIMGKNTQSLLDPLYDIRDNTSKRTENPNQSRR